MKILYLNNNNQKNKIESIKVKSSQRFIWISNFNNAEPEDIFPKKKRFPKKEINKNMANGNRERK